MKSLDYNERRYIASYLRVVDDGERLRREAIAQWQLAEAKRRRRRRIVVGALIALAAIVA